MAKKLFFSALGVSTIAAITHSSGTFPVAVGNHTGSITLGAYTDAPVIDVVADIVAAIEAQNITSFGRPVETTQYTPTLPSGDPSPVTFIMMTYVVDTAETYATPAIDYDAASINSAGSWEHDEIDGSYAYPPVGMVASADVATMIIGAMGASAFAARLVK